MAPIVIRSHHYCGICNRRIKNMRNARRLGTLSFQYHVDAYIEYSGRNVDITTSACDICHVRIKHGNFDLITPVNPPQNNVTHARELVYEELPIAVHSNGNAQIDSQASTLYEDSQASSLYENSQASHLHEDSQASNIYEDSLNCDDNELTELQARPQPLPFTGEDVIASIFKKPTIDVKLRSCAKTEKRCCICKGSGRFRVPKRAIIDVWLKKQIVIPMNNRCCTSHLNNKGLLKKTAVESIAATKNHIRLSGEELKTFFNAFADERKYSTFSRIDFNETSPLTDEDYHNLTGLSIKSFTNLHQIVCIHLRKSTNRSTRNALGLFLVKLRLNLSHHFLGFLFNIDNVPKVSAVFESVRKALEIHFVPKFLGYDHLTREDAKKHQTKMASTLLHSRDDSLAVAIDGTYLYVQKSKNHELQKMTFSSHKHRNLLKPMIIAFTDGYILESEGLFFANNDNNDANILKHILSRPYGFSKFFQENDQFVLDRGFRDVVGTLEANKYQVFMPHLLKKKQKQFETTEANESRIVTMIRWIIESVNGRLKKWKFFANIIEVSFFPKLGSLVRIACALINAYGTPFVTESDDHLKMAEIALQKIGAANEMQKKIADLDLENKRVVWSKDLQEVEDFPKLSLSQLKLVTLGEFQVNNAENYTRQHLNEDGSFPIFIHIDESFLLRAKIGSRFVSRRSHQLWISYDPIKEGEESITSYYCKCQIGSRVVGCCSHVTCILWYLGYARHNRKALQRLSTRNGIADNILNATDTFEENESESEESESEEQVDL